VLEENNVTAYVRSELKLHLIFLYYRYLNKNACNVILKTVLIVLIKIVCNYYKLRYLRKSMIIIF